MTVSRRRFLQLAAGVGAVAAVPGFRSAAGARPRQAPLRGEWLAGDFHCHTVLSHDVWGGPGDDNTDVEDFYTFGWTAGEQIANAELRGLDFLAVTDHDRIDALHLPEYRSDQLVLVPGYEHSLAGGHAGVFMTTVDALPDIVRYGTDKSFNGDAGLARFVDLVHERGGLTVLNHPFYGNESDGEQIAWGYGVAASSAMDAVEVWNIGWPARHDTIPVADSDNYLSLPWWEHEIVSRRRVPAVGGSDNHYRATFAAQGVGQPTTWVHAADRTPAAVLDGVRAGRTFVSAQPPAQAGPRLFLSAAPARGGRKPAMVGGTVPAGTPLDVTVQVENGMGSRLRLVSTGMVVGETSVVVPATTEHFGVVLPADGWLRAELFVEPGYYMSALTSPIWAGRRAGSADPTTGPAVTY